jgi:hypothetical protein
MNGRVRPETDLPIWCHTGAVALYWNQGNGLRTCWPIIKRRTVHLYYKKQEARHFSLYTVSRYHGLPPVLPVTLDT